jgi:hypothetical protein
MITAFSFRANGWVNYKMPNIPTPATIARGRAIMFPPMDDAFAYATKQAAERFNIDQPAILREWAKVIPTLGAGE